MNKQIEALKMAIEALEGIDECFWEHTVLQACKEALAEAEKQEPVALIRHENGNFSPAPSWQSLSDNEINKLADKYSEPLPNGEIFHFDLFARAIEAKLKEKNQGRL